jgi:ubiquinone/menaquinone biosynthesis C-methylase UbiE
MNKNEKYSIKKYDSIAKNYASSPDGKFTINFKRKMLEFCEVIDGNTILDVGCGNGDLINEIALRGSVKAYGVDISPNMVKECHKRYDNAVFMLSTGEAIPFGDSIFDTLTICCALHHFNKPKIFFEEARRVLIRNGILIIGEPWFPFGLRQFNDWFVSPLIRAGDNKLFSHKTLKRLFTDNGFEIIEIYKKNIIQVIKGRKL